MNDRQHCGAGARYRKCLIWLMCCSFWLAATVSAQPHEPEIHGVFDGDPMYTLLPLDGIPAIRAPEFVTGEDAAAQMQADEPILGLAAGGEAKAYSLWQLDAHEIVNDTLAGKAVAVTW